MKKGISCEIFHRMMNRVNAQVKHVSEIEPCREKTCILHMQKQSRRSTAQLISALVFATYIVQSFYFINMEFQASSHLLWLWSPVGVRPSRETPKTGFLATGLNWCNGLKIDITSTSQVFRTHLALNLYIYSCLTEIIKTFLLLITFTSPVGNTLFCSLPLLYMFCRHQVNYQ